MGAVKSVGINKDKQAEANYRPEDQKKKAGPILRQDSQSERSGLSESSSGPSAALLEASSNSRLSSQSSNEPSILSCTNSNGLSRQYSSTSIESYSNGKTSEKVLMIKEQLLSDRPASCNESPKQKSTYCGKNEIVFQTAHQMSDVRKKTDGNMLNTSETCPSNMEPPQDLASFRGNLAEDENQTQNKLRCRPETVEQTINATTWKLIDLSFRTNKSIERLQDVTKRLTNSYKTLSMIARVHNEKKKHKDIIEPFNNFLDKSLSGDLVTADLLADAKLASAIVMKMATKLDELYRETDTLETQHKEPDKAESACKQMNDSMNILLESEKEMTEAIDDLWINTVRPE